MANGQTDDGASPLDSADYWDRLWAPCDIASVVVFRVVFALIVLLHVGLYFWNHSIEYYFGRPTYHLSYFGFEWVQPFELEGMRRVYYLMGLAAIGVGLGCLYRISAVVLFVTFTFTFLAEAAQFQNHYYLMCLVAFLLILIPAHRSFSIDSILVPDKASSSIPNWCRWILMFQIAIPYTYGGIAKINWDWLQAMPLKYWLPENIDLPIIAPLMNLSATAWFMSYFGLIFDLAVVPLLLWKRTRIWVFGLAVVFHLSNKVLFGIDVFPWMMIGTTTIFFSASWPRRWIRLGTPVFSDNVLPVRHLTQWAITGILALFVTWQLLFPLRHWLYADNPSWTEEGQQFAWRMLVRHKRTFFVFYVTDGASGEMMEVPLNRLMTPKQMFEVGQCPDQMVACSQFLADWGRTQLGIKDPEIRAFVLSSMNGRRPQFLVDPDLDLLTVQRSMRSQPGIMPLEESLRQVAWNVPVPEWLKELDITVPVSVPVDN